MKIKLLLAAISLSLSLSTLADCQVDNKKSVIAAPIVIDLSSKLNAISKTYTVTTTTNFVGAYNCFFQIGGNYIKVVNTLEQGSSFIGFNDGKNIVEVILNDLTNEGIKNISPGAYNATNLNTQFTMTFKLKDTPPLPTAITIPGSSFEINAAIIGRDMSGIDLVSLLVALVVKLLAFLLTLKWPIDEKDLFIQPVTVIYSPVMTTCNLSNNNLFVDLPLITMKDLKTTTRPGYTPFTLNFSCSNLINNTNSSQNISVYLASDHLLASDKTVLTNTKTRGAKNVGFRVVKAENLSTPLVFSNSDNMKNGATDIFFVPKAGPLASFFSVNLGAYYYPYGNNDISAGAVSSSARVIFSYD